MKESVSFRTMGVCGLFSGAALVTHITSGFSLWMGLLLAGSIVVLGVWMRWRRSSHDARSRMLRFTRVGLIAGLLATGAYDISRFALSRWDDSPYNPFEAVRAFGLALVGTFSSTPSVYVAGSAFHLLNGLFFGVAFCFFLGHRGVVAGVAWGFFLELFQLTLYPGWLNIGFYEEFLQISALSHLAYGAVLGLICKFALRGA